MANHKTELLENKDDTKICQYPSSVGRLKTGGCIIWVSNECCVKGDNYFLWSLALPLLTHSRKPLAFVAATVTAGSCSACCPPAPRAFSIRPPQRGRISLSWNQGHFLSRNRMLHLFFLNFIRLDHFSRLSRLRMSVWALEEFNGTTKVVSANLVTKHSATSSKSLTKLFKRTSPRMDPCNTYYWPSCRVQHISNYLLSPTNLLSLFFFTYLIVHPAWLNVLTREQEYCGRVSKALVKSR